MAPPSKIRQLPPEVRARIDQLLNDGVQLDAIMAKLAELGVTDISRSGLGRYKQSLDKVGEKLRHTREISNAFIEKLGAAPEGKQGRLLVEMTQSVIFDLLLAAGDGDPSEGGGEARGLTLDPMAVMLVAKSLKDLSSAQKSDADLVLRIRQEAAKEASAAVDRVAKSRGLSAETVADLKEQFLGIARKP
jgi:hypothetical protein